MAANESGVLSAHRDVRDDSHLTIRSLADDDDDDSFACVLALELF